MCRHRSLPETLFRSILHTSQSFVRRYSVASTRRALILDSRSSSSNFLCLVKLREKQSGRPGELLPPVPHRSGHAVSTPVFGVKRLPLKKHGFQEKETDSGIVWKISVKQEILRISSTKRPASANPLTPSDYTGGKRQVLWPAKIQQLFPLKISGSPSGTGKGTFN